jgi:hypothetical protein
MKDWVLIWRPGVLRAWAVTKIQKTFCGFGGFCGQKFSVVSVAKLSVAVGGVRGATEERRKCAPETHRALQILRLTRFVPIATPCNSSRIR